MRLRLAMLSGVGAVVLLTCSAATQAQFQEPGRAEALAKAAQKPTPLLPDGHPDLNGYWHHDMVAAPNTQIGNTTYLFGENAASPAAPGRGGGAGRGPAPNPNKPLYKPEFSAKVADLALHETKDDPAYSCKPLGVPRVGA